MNVFGICFGVIFGICIYIYGCKYCHELCYKTPISDTGVMSLWLSCCYALLCFSCWFSPQKDDHCKCCNELGYKALEEVCFLFSVVLLGINVV